jgi:hypothetical protein
MKDTAYPVRKAYYTLLSGLGYTVFDSKAPDAASKPYVILGSQTSNSENTKTSFDNRVTINIDIVTAYIDGFGGRKDLDLIVDVILQAAIPQAGQSGVSVTGFNIVSTKKLTDYTFEPQVQIAQTIYRKVIIIEHLLEQS